MIVFLVAMAWLLPSWPWRRPWHGFYPPGHGVVVTLMAMRHGVVTLLDIASWPLATADDHWPYLAVEEWWGCHGRQRGRRGWMPCSCWSALDGVWSPKVLVWNLHEDQWLIFFRDSEKDNARTSCFNKFQIKADYFFTEYWIFEMKFGWDSSSTRTNFWFFWVSITFRVRRSVMLPAQIFFTFFVCKKRSMFLFLVIVCRNLWCFEGSI